MYSGGYGPLEDKEIYQDFQAETLRSHGQYQRGLRAEWRGQCVLWIKNGR